MGALSPLFLVAGLTVAVPIFLHLFQRHQVRRLSFPALRYLERTEREHARRIRLRQLLLLLARVLALVLVVGAGARLVFLGRGASHPPTAVAIVLDNSMSSGLVVGETRVLDELKSLALQTIAEASDEDRFWVVRAGEPWLPAIPGGAREARAAIDETTPSAARGDLSAALARAAGLVTGSDLAAREIHLLSDLQATEFASGGGAPAGDLPVVVWTGPRQAAPNRALTRIVVGGGLPPLEGQRSEVTVSALGAAGDTSRVAVRLVVGERIRGAATVPAGAEASIALPPAGNGWVRGYVDADPDALRADDRRFFAYRSRPAPTIAIGGDPGLFVTQAVSVLEAAARLTRSDATSATLLVAESGEGLERRGASTAALVLPPSDPTLLPGLNRRLADAGIGWRYAPRTGSGEAVLEGRALPPPLEGVTVRAWLDLERAGDAVTPSQELAELAGAPWAVEGTDAEGRRYLVVASSMGPTATSLPVSTGMVRFVDWAASEWAGSGGVSAERPTGSHLPAPQAATQVRFPSGREVEIDGTRTVRGTGEAGFYTFLAGDSVLSVVALNPPAEESVLEPLDARAYDDRIGASVHPADDPGAWRRAVYRARQGPELWWPLLLAALVLLLAESLMATSGQREESVERESPRAAAPNVAR